MPWWVILIMVLRSIAISWFVSSVWLAFYLAKGLQW